MYARPPPPSPFFLPPYVAAAGGAAAAAMGGGGEAAAKGSATAVAGGEGRGEPGGRGRGGAGGEGDASEADPQPPCTGIFASHTDWVTALAVAAAGRIMASASNDGTLKLWDLAAADRGCAGDGGQEDWERGAGVGAGERLSGLGGKGGGAHAAAGVANGVGDGFRGGGEAPCRLYTSGWYCFTGTVLSISLFKVSNTGVVNFCSRPSYARLLLTTIITIVSTSVGGV